MAKKSLAFTQPESDRPSFREVNGPPDSAAVMRLLWEKAANHLSPDELAWMADADEMAMLALGNLKSVLQSLALGGNKISSGGDETVAFFFCSEQMDTVQSLMEVAGAANYRLREMDKRSSAGA